MSILESHLPSMDHMSTQTILGRFHGAFVHTRRSFVEERSGRASLDDACCVCIGVVHKGLDHTNDKDSIDSVVRS